MGLRAVDVSRFGRVFLTRSARGSRLRFGFGPDCCAGAAGSALAAGAASAAGVSSTSAAGVSSAAVSSVVVVSSFSVSDISLPLLCRGLALVDDRQDPRDLTLCHLQARVVLECARDRLEAQVEKLLPPFREPVIQLVVGQITKFARPSQRAQPLSSPLWS